jgi:hypothetical protein
METYNFFPSLTNFVSRHLILLKYAEIISLLIFAIGIIMHFMAIENADIVLEIGSVLIAIIYWLLAFKLVEVENTEASGKLNSSVVIRYIYKVTYIAFFLLFIAIATQILNSKISESLLSVVVFTLIFVLIISLLTKGIDRSKIYNFSYYLRLISALILLLVLFNIHFELF